MLDQPLTLADLSHVVKAIKNNKSAESDSRYTVRELIKYGGKPKCEILLMLLNFVWDNECAPTRSYWKDGLIASLFKKGDRKDPGNYTTHNPSECGR